jgi:hypothetical protein
VLFCVCRMHGAWLAAWLALLVPSSSGSRKFLNYTGDIMLGALFPIHHKGSGGADCGKIQVSFDMQLISDALLSNRSSDMFRRNLLPLSSG